MPFFWSSDNGDFVPADDEDGEDEDGDDEDAKAMGGSGGGDIANHGESLHNLHLTLLMLTHSLMMMMMTMMMMMMMMIMRKLTKTMLRCMLRGRK